MSDEEPIETRRWRVREDGRTHLHGREGTDAGQAAPGQRWVLLDGDDHWAERPLAFYEYELDLIEEARRG